MTHHGNARATGSTRRTGRVGPLGRVSTTGVAAALGAVVLAGCSGELDARTHADATTTAAGPTSQATKTASPPHTTATASGPTSSNTVAQTVTGIPTFTEGVGMSEWLPYKNLSVRVIEYTASVAPAPGFRDRIDAVQVEECAKGPGPATVSHQSWSLTDAEGKTLGRAGGKIVDGSPTEDPPLQLAAGECAQTILSVGVPTDATAVYAHDGPDNTWVL